MTERIDDLTNGKNPEWRTAALDIVRDLKAENEALLRQLKLTQQMAGEAMNKVESLLEDRRWLKTQIGLVIEIFCSEGKFD